MRPPAWPSAHARGPSARRLDPERDERARRARDLGTRAGRERRLGGRLAVGDQRQRERRRRTRRGRPRRLAARRLTTSGRDRRQRGPARHGPRPDGRASVRALERLVLDEIARDRLHDGPVGLQRRRGALLGLPRRSRASRRRSARACPGPTLPSSCSDAPRKTSALCSPIVTGPSDDMPNEVTIERASWVAACRSSLTAVETSPNAIRSAAAPAIATVSWRWRSGRRSTVRSRSSSSAVARPSRRPRATIESWCSCAPSPCAAATTACAASCTAIVSSSSSLSTWVSLRGPPTTRSIASSRSCTPIARRPERALSSAASLITFSSSAPVKPGQRRAISAGDDVRGARAVLRR